ncbi:MAG: MamI family restriction endonuclease [Oligoflexia bacterium]|nr:MamI family restriction endonuclease [Oligoflexia bacterium]
MMKDSNRLGDLSSSEQLIRDLYIDLRKKVNYWASQTKQTAQARMGYVGQHLVSVVTGYSGGKSGARGKDLILNADDYAEIKTCYRVDQLGKCLDCHSVVASIELKCAYCNSENIERKQDSKWLLSIRNDDEFEKILEPKFYYLVLFDLQNIKNPNKIRASIWKVDSHNIGFVYCMIDYYLNIRSKSKSKAPFNLWPFQLKFYLMLPKLIYRSYILDNNIKTEIFHKEDHIIDFPKPFHSYSSASNLTKEKVIEFAQSIGFEGNKDLDKKELILQVDTFMKDSGGFNEQRVMQLAKSLYYRDIKEHMRKIPKKFRKFISL